jgi:hypothetical protein
MKSGKTTKYLRTSFQGIAIKVDRISLSKKFAESIPEWEYVTIIYNRTGGIGMQRTDYSSYQIIRTKERSYVNYPGIQNITPSGRYKFAGFDKDGLAFLINTTAVPVAHEECSPR